MYRKRREIMSFRSGPAGHRVGRPTARAAAWSPRPWRSGSASPSCSGRPPAPAASARAEPCFERMTPDEANLTPVAPAARLPHRGDAGRTHPVTAAVPAPGREPAAPLRGGHPRAWPRPARASSWAGARRSCSARAAGSTCGSTGRRARVVQGAAIEAISEDEARRHLARPTGPATPTSAACTAPTPPTPGTTTW